MVHRKLSAEAARRDFDVWLDGYPRCGNTFAALALAEVLPHGCKIRTHTHQPALILSAVAQGKPGIFVIRSPKECASSWALFAGKPVGELLDYFIDFHRVLLPYRDRMLIASFPQITADFGQVVDRFGARFGIEVRPFEHTSESVERIFGKMENKQREERHGTVNELTIWRPSAERDALKAQLAREFETNAELQEKLRMAEELYARFAPAEAASPEPATARLEPVAAAEPRLLIVIPTLGDSPHLDAAVESARALHVRKRIMLAAPATRVAALQRRYPDVELVKDAGRAGGLAGALNEAIAAAGSDWDWFTYAEEHDLFTNDFAAVVAQHCRPENAGTIAYGDVELIDEIGRSLGRATAESSPAYFPALLQSGILPLNTPGLLVSASVLNAIGGFDPEFPRTVHCEFCIRARAASYRLRYYPSTVGRFRALRGYKHDEQAAELEAIRQRNQLPPASAPERLLASIRYRLLNSPRYIERWRALGTWLSRAEISARGLTAMEGLSTGK
jgi:hypothetical protein